MRPTPSQTIAGIRTILKDVVEPEVGSEYARTRLREVRAVLAQIDWDDALLHLRRRGEEVRRLLADIRSWIESDPERANGFADLTARIDAEPEGPAETYSELSARHDADAALLVDAGDALASWERAHPDAGPADSGRELRVHILRGLAT